MAFGDSIQIGHPLKWQDVADAINTHYPDYDFLISSSQVGRPLVFSGTTPIEASFAVLIAMLCPPNTPARTSSVGGLPLQNVGTDFGISALYEPGTPLIAADVFVNFISSTYSGPSRLADAISDIDAQLLVYRSTHLQIRELGNLVSQYDDGADAIATCKFAGRDFS